MPGATLVWANCFESKLWASAGPAGFFGNSGGMAKNLGLPWSSCSMELMTWVRYHGLHGTMEPVSDAGPWTEVVPGVSPGSLGVSPGVAPAGHCFINHFPRSVELSHKHRLCETLMRANCRQDLAGLPYGTHEQRQQEANKQESVHIRSRKQYIYIILYIYIYLYFYNSIYIYMYICNIT